MKREEAADVLILHIPTFKYDGSLVMGNLMNAAESLGIASIWIHRAKEPVPRKDNYVYYIK